MGQRRTSLQQLAISAAIPAVALAVTATRPHISIAALPLVIGSIVIVEIGVVVATYAPHLFRNWRPKVWPVIFMVVGAALYISGAWWFYEANKEPPVSFQKYALFWVETEKNVYQIGVVAKLFNLDDRPYLVQGIVFDGHRWSLFPRGGYLIRRLQENEAHFEQIEDNYIKPSNEGYFKILLPIKFDMVVQGGSAPDFVLRGSWDLMIGGERFRVTPSMYVAYLGFITLNDWKKLLKKSSSINVDDLPYDALPPLPPDQGATVYRLLYSNDRSAQIRNPYISHIGPIRGDNGAMAFIGYRGELAIPDGWTVLGKTYHEVWTDPEKLTLYNSLVPPDANGLPQAFGFFAGAEDEMAGPIGRPLMAPTTRAADIIDFHWPEPPKPWWMTLLGN